MSTNKILAVSAVTLLAGFSVTASAEPIRAGKNTLGLSVGASAPSDSLNLDTIAVRYRVNHRMTLEPMFRYSQITGSDTMLEESYDYDEDGNEVVTSSEVSTDTSTTVMDFGMNLRYRLRYSKMANNSAADMYMIVGGGYTSISSETDYDGSDTTSTSGGNALGVNLGFGLEGWMNQHWSAGIDAVTTIYGQMSGESNYDGKGDPDTSTTMTAISLVPQLRLMVSCYY